MLLERHADIRRRSPGDTAIAQFVAGVEANIEFGREVGAVRQLQFCALAAQIADDATDRPAPRQQHLGALVYLGLRKTPPLRHGLPAIRNLTKMALGRMSFAEGNAVVGEMLICGNSSRP